MAFTRKALKARGLVRKNRQCGYVETLREGEAGYRNQTSNPYELGTEDHETWQSGYDDESLRCA